MRRKLEERAVPIPVSAAGDGPAGLALEGLFLAAPEPDCGGAVIAPPHPLMGGSMDSPVVSELAWACSHAGLASLRFNWRGCGASAGAATGDPATADADYAAALAQLAETVPGPLVAAGYSFGAAAALRAAGSPRVRRVVLVAPPPELLGEGGLATLDAPLLVLTGSRDRLAPAPALEALLAAHTQARLVTIPEADHFFAAGLAGLGAAAREWLARD